MVNKKLRNKRKRIQKYPFVSLCTPTFNRRPFFKYLIKCIYQQTYPKDRMEWIIIDDGTDKIKDLVEDIPFVRYFEYDEKMKLGKKRNLMHSHSKGDFIVYIDDDDYYPPERVEHSVQTLLKHPKALCGGSSEIYLYFKHIDTVYQFGPYGPNHATAGTFAFRRELLNKTRYNEDAALAEEKEFLKNYSIPFVQFDPMKTILVFSHIHNTFDKKELLKNPNPKVVKPSNKKVYHFIKDDDIRDFYMNRINDLLKDYDFGNIKNKPDVVEQTKQIKERRDKMREEASMKRFKDIDTPLIMNTPNGKKHLSVYDCIQLIQQMQNDMNKLNQINSQLKKQNQELMNKMNDITSTSLKLTNDMSCNSM